MDLLDRLQACINLLSQFFTRVVFFEIGPFPIIVMWLLLGAIFATLRMGFINLRGMGHAINVLRGRYDTDDEEGEVSHLQALSTALSATVGLGNIAGVAIAIRMGGPGAVLWMTLGGFLGMNTKFIECTLGQKYRVMQPDGTATGGPMYYLSLGLAELGKPRLGQVLATFFAICSIGGSLGAASMFQVNQSYGAVAQILPIPNWLYGLVMMALVGSVLVGGVQRVGQVASLLVPAMCVIYAGSALWIIGVHAGELPEAVATIVQGALHPAAIAGGAVGVMVQGLRRAVFASEAGVGSAAIAHAAARTQEPVREGLVAMLEPLVDSGLICTLTALVLILTGAYADPTLADLSGSELTAAAFASVIPWFPVILAITVFCFAFSTMIAAGYYGACSWSFLFQNANMGIYKALLLGSIFVGSIATATAVVDFSDGMFMLMAVPNLLGVYLLSNGVAHDLKDYFQRMKTWPRVEPQQTALPVPSIAISSSSRSSP